MFSGPARLRRGNLPPSSSTPIINNWNQPFSGIVIAVTMTVTVLGRWQVSF